MALIRDIWDAVQSRLENDSQFRNFFSMLRNDIKTEAIDTNYFRLVPGAIGPTEIAAVTGNPPQMGIEFTIKMLLIVFHDDPITIFDQFIKGVEIFFNAMFKSDVVFGNKITNVPILTFDTIIPISNKAGWAIEGQGQMVLQLQKFLGGKL